MAWSEWQEEQDKSGAIVRKECNEHNNMKAFSLKYEAEIKSRGRKAD